MTTATQTFDRDVNLPATAKQVQAVSMKFAKILQKKLKVSDKQWFILWKRVQACLVSQNPEGISHGQVQEFFKMTTAPKFILDNLQTEGLDGNKAKPVAKVTKVSKTAKGRTKAQIATLKSTKSPETLSPLADRMTKIEDTLAILLKAIQS